MEVIIVDKLGAMVAFRPKHIEFLRETYDKIPEAQRDNLNTILHQCKQAYDDKVADDKSKGIRPNPTAIKNDVFESILYPWLNSFGVETGASGKRSETRTVKATNPRIPNDKKDEVTDQIKIDEGMVSSIYDNNYPTDLMDDDAPTHESVVLDGEDESLFEGDFFEDASVDFSSEDVSLFEDDDFDFNVPMEEDLL